MRLPFIISLIVYFVLLFIMSKFLAKKEQKNSAGSFLMANKSLPLALIVGTTVATLIGTGSSVGAVGYAYNNGFAGALYGLGGGLGVLFLAFLFSGVRKYGFITMPEEIAFYYGGNKYVKGLVSVVVYLACIGWMGAHIIGGSAYISYITNLSPTVAKIVVALGFSIIALLGGYLAVVWTDTIQAIVLFIGFIAMLIFGVNAAGGLTRVINDFPAAGTSFLGLEKVGIIPGISFAAAIAIGILATPSFRQRIYSSASVQVSRRSFFISAAFYFLFSTLPAITGMAAWHLNPDIKSANLVFPFMAVQVLPLFLGILALLAGVSATVSSASSDAMVSVSIFLKDIFAIFSKKRVTSKTLVVLSKIVLAFSTVLALTFTLVADNVITYITSMIATLMSGLFVVAVMGRFWKRSTAWGCICALVVASVVSLLIINTPALKAYWGNPILPSVGASLIVLIVVSLLTKRHTLSDKDILHNLAQAREEFDK